jgi:hypothetical protein
MSDPFSQELAGRELPQANGVIRTGSGKERSTAIRDNFLLQLGGRVRVVFMVAFRNFLRGSRKNMQTALYSRNPGEAKTCAICKDVFFEIERVFTAVVIVGQKRACSSGNYNRPLFGIAICSP